MTVSRKRLVSYMRYTIPAIEGYHYGHLLPILNTKKDSKFNQKEMELFSYFTTLLEEYSKKGIEPITRPENPDIAPIYDTIISLGNLLGNAIFKLESFKTRFEDSSFCFELENILDYANHLATCKFWESELFSLSASDINQMSRYIDVIITYADMYERILDDFDNLLMKYKAETSFIEMNQIFKKPKPLPTIVNLVNPLDIKE